MSEFNRHPEDYSVSANPYTEENGVRCATLKIQHDTFEFNVHINHEEFQQIYRKDPGTFGDRESMKVGNVQGIPAFWTLESTFLGVSVGSDDESWMIAFVLPIELLQTIRATLFELLPWLKGGSPPEGFLEHDPADYDKPPSDNL